MGLDFSSVLVLLGCLLGRGLCRFMSVFLGIRGGGCTFSRTGCRILVSVYDGNGAVYDETRAERNLAFLRGEA
jgi:hypothetical protein